MRCTHRSLIFLPIFVLLVLLLWPGAGLAEALAPESRVKMQGEWTQGAVILGQAPPGTKITLNKKQVPIAADGHFVIGFPRKAKLTWTLNFTYPDGKGWSYFVALKSRKYKVQHIKGLPKRQVTPNAQDQKRIAENRKAIRAARSRFTRHALFASGLVWPVRGRISGVYGSQRVLNGEPRRPHFGIDIANKTGTPIVAPADAIVALAHEDTFYSGNMIILDHGLGLTTTYAHMSALKVTEGQKVKQGDLIGLVGSTGRSTGPHLHWGLNWNKMALDPSTILPPMGKAKGK